MKYYTAVLGWAGASRGPGAGARQGARRPPFLPRNRIPDLCSQY